MRLILPYPPSMNRYWRSIGRGRVIISRAGRAYAADIAACLAYEPDFRPFEARQRLDMRVEAWTPDRRRRDLDNILKPLLDALQKAGLYQDDQQIDRLLIERRGVVAGGRVIVTVVTIDTVARIIKPIEVKARVSTNTKKAQPVG